VPIVARKVGVFGDSTSIAQQGGLDRAARIYAWDPARFGNAGYNNCAQGGQSLAANYNQHVFRDGLPQPPFPRYITETDDSDIVVIILGGNDPVTSASGKPIYGDAATAADYIGCDNLPVAALYLQHVQQARAAGKRPVIAGLPYYDPERALASGGLYVGQSPEMARTFAVRLAVNNAAARVVAGMQNVPFIATYGFGGAGGQPPADHNSTYDGLHPTKAYSEAVSDYIAAQLIKIFGL